MTIQDTSTTLRVTIPHDHTRSALDRNFMAAAISRNPIATLTRASHGPDRGTWLANCGAAASATNGSANVAEYASSPATGRCHSPCAATTSRVPRNAAVHVSDVTVKVAAMSSVPVTDAPRCREAASARDTSRYGSGMSNTPNRFSANTTNNATMPRLTHGFAANRFSPAAPASAARIEPDTVNVSTMPRP